MDNHSVLYERIKRLYDSGRITKEKVAMFTAKGAITPEEYEEITGEPYKEGK